MRIPARDNPVLQLKVLVFSPVMSRLFRILYTVKGVMWNGSEYWECVCIKHKISSMAEPFAYIFSLSIPRISKEFLKISRSTSVPRQNQERQAGNHLGIASIAFSYHGI